MRRGRRACCSTGTFRKGFACLAPLGLSFDAWLFHPQIGELTDLARAFPGTKIVLDHCGGPIGIGSYAGRREEIFPVWKASIQEIAKCENVVVKLGGLAMCLLGYDFHLRPKPPSSEEAAAAWRPYIETCIEAFGPNRCMFESNFPPDKGQCSYQVIFNAFKRLATQYSEAEKTALFSKTATEFYKLKLVITIDGQDVMAGLVPAIHDLQAGTTWLPGRHRRDGTNDGISRVARTLEDPRSSLRSDAERDAATSPGCGSSRPLALAKHRHAASVGVNAVDVGLA